jgi:SNF2 family DNA or RNA helicase
MPKDFTPRGYQDAGTRFLIEHDRAALFEEPGLGKSVQTANAIDSLILCGETSQFLIIAPMRVARTTWKAEFAKWNHLCHHEVVAVVGTPKQRIEALQSKAQIKCINYENLPWLAEQLGDKWPFKTVIFDESSKVKAFRCHFATSKKGNRFMKCTAGERISAVAKKCFTHTKRVWLLTGTPCANSLADLWAQIFLIDKGQRLGDSFTAFENRWYKLGFNGYTMIMLPHAEKEIRDAIADVVFTLRAEDYMDLGEEITNTIFVDIPRTNYDEMELKLYTQIQAGGVEAFTAATKSGKLHQIANGAIYWDDKGSFEDIHDAKILALQSIIEEASGMPVIVVYKFKSDLYRLQKAFPKGKAFDTKKETEDNFKRGEIPVLFLHPASASHGIDGFQNVTNIICFFSLDWNAEERQQVIARVGKVRQYQAGLNRPTFIHQIVARNTIDEDILLRIEKKITIEEALKAGLARRIEG